MSLRSTNDLDFVTRFVCTGSEDGCHSVLFTHDYKDKVTSLHSLLAKEGAIRVIRKLRTIFEGRHYLTKDPLLYALATIVKTVTVKDGREEYHVINEAYSLALDTCDCAIDLFTFIDFHKTMSGLPKNNWGPGMTHIVKRWYENKNPFDLARATTRCKSGRGMTHRDIIRWGHIATHTNSKAATLVMLYLYHGKKILQDYEVQDTEATDVLRFLKDIELLRASTGEDKELIRNLIETYKLDNYWQSQTRFRAVYFHQRVIELNMSSDMPINGIMDTIAKPTNETLEQRITWTCKS